MSVRPTVLVVQHVACESLGTIARSLQHCELAARHIKVHEGDRVPAALDDECGLIVLGGPMSVYEYDRLIHLMQEMRLIGSALALHRPVLGICLGSQLLAHVLGAKVRAGIQKEIGWHRIKLSDSACHDPLWADCAAEFAALHWHGDVFDVPPNATCLASSDLTACQAFRAGESAYGVLFHMEVTESQIDGMAQSFPDEAALAGGLAGLRAGSAEHLPRLATIGEHFFTGWARLAGACARTSATATEGARHP